MGERGGGGLGFEKGGAGVGEEGGRRKGKGVKAGEEGRRRWW